MPNSKDWQDGHRAGYEKGVAEGHKNWEKLKTILISKPGIPTHFFNAPHGYTRWILYIMGKIKKNKV